MVALALQMALREKDFMSGIGNECNVFLLGYICHLADWKIISE